MKKRVLAVLLAACSLSAVPSSGQVAQGGLDHRLIDAGKTVTPQQLRADDETLVAFGTRNIFSGDLGPKRGITAARDWIEGQFKAVANESAGRMSVSVDSFLQKADGKRVVHDVTLSNVLAVLKGSEDSTRTYVISCHYDSRITDVTDGVHDAPGADDNASGVVVVLAAARALVKLPVKATIIFAVYTGEEQGLLGSQHHAQALKDAGVDVEGDLNNDIVGASVGPNGEKNPYSIRIFSEALPGTGTLAKINQSGGENDSDSRELARFVKEIGDQADAPMKGDLVYRYDRYLRGSDHMSFLKVGFPALRLTEPVENFNHQHQDVRVEGGVHYGDLVEFVDFDYLARVARYNIAAIGTLALAPATPRDAVTVTKELTNETDLTWSAVPGAARYEIVTRLTYEPFWSGVQDGGTGQTAHVPLSKDNYLFGIRAIDAEGHKSPAAFPTPQR
jgi:Peptidase family M28